MDRRSEPRARPDLVVQAESLIRSLRGVSHVSVAANARGIDAVHVVAGDAELAPHLAGHVRSALLAGLGAPVMPSRIHVRVDSAGRPAAEPRPRVPGTEPGRAEDERAGHGAPENGAPETVAPQPDGRATLVSVRTARASEGRTSCAVAVSRGDARGEAEAAADDREGGALLAAARAATAALTAAGLDGLELDGVRGVTLGHGRYALVALRQDADAATPRTRSGSAELTGAPGRAAAEATVAAANGIGRPND